MRENRRWGACVRPTPPVAFFALSIKSVAAAPHRHTRTLRGQRMKSDSEGGEKLLILKRRRERDEVSSSCLPSSFLPKWDGMRWLPFLKGLQVAPATRLPPRLGYRRRYLHVRSFSLGCIHFQPMPLVGQTSSYSSMCNEKSF